MNSLINYLEAFLAIFSDPLDSLSVWPGEAA